MPDTHKSGFIARISFTPNFTQSTGVPEQWYSVTAAPAAEVLCTYKVLFIVMACPMALCGLSGATTTTSPISLITAISARIPGAVMPSSLVTSISGFVDMLVVNDNFIAVTKRRVVDFYKIDAIAQTAYIKIVGI